MATGLVRGPLHRVIAWWPGEKEALLSGQACATVKVRLKEALQVKTITPRDITCWYCQHEQHAKCFSTVLCACCVCREAERLAAQAECSRLQVAK